MASTLFPVLAGPFVGSFCGVLICRLARGETVGWSRSRCETCHHVLGPAELVPIVSYLAQRGRCRWCAAPIGRFHMQVELLAAAIALWACLQADTPARAWTDSAFGWALMTLAWIDWRSQILPDVITLPLLLAGLAVTWWQSPFDITDHALAAACGYGGIALLAWAYRSWRGRHGIGMGDAKLLAAGGTWIGINALPWALALGAGLGIIAGLARGLSFDSKVRSPFGPWLALSLWLLR